MKIILVKHMQAVDINVVQGRSYKNVLALSTAFHWQPPSLEAASGKC